MSNTIGPKSTPDQRVDTRVAPPKAQPAQPSSAGATAPGWQPTGRQPSTAAQAIAPGSGQKEIMCPVLRALVNEGRVQMAPDGSVNLGELNHAVRALGASKPLGAATWAIGAIGNTPSDILANVKGHQMNVVNLPEGIVPHPADTQILRSGKFDEAKFQALARHAENGVMTTDSFASAIAANYVRDREAGAGFVDATARGLNFAQLEFAGLLSVFGTKDPATGKVGISVDDLRVLYEKGTIPPGMQGQSSSVLEAARLQASLKLKSDAKLAQHAFGSVLTAVGLSKAGARLSIGADDDTPVGQLASASAGKAANCPHLSGKVKMPTAPADVVNAHTR